MHLAPRPVTCRCDSWCSLSHAVGPGRARGLAAPRFFVRARVVSGGGDRMSEVNGSNECIDHGLFQTNASMFITDAGRCAALPDQQIPAAMLSAEAGD